jgi:hypothetical protein
MKALPQCEAADSNGSASVRVRQCIESVFWTCKGQLGVERHGARTLPGLCARVGLWLLALAAGLRHNAEIGQPGRCFSAYGH